MKWSQVLELHGAAVEAFAQAAQRIPQEAWLTPAAEGKWSPGHVLEHVNLTYEVVQRELNGGLGMAVITKAWQRILMRFTVMPKILRGGWFPKGARAPREIRPANAAPDRDAAIATFRQRAKKLEDKAIAVQAAGGAKLTHAYFGTGDLPQTLLLCTRHVEHHTRQLEALQKS
jgi:hypothetical protein